MKIKNILLAVPCATIGTLTVPNIAYCDTPIFCVINYPSTADCPDCTAVTRIIDCGDNKKYCDCSACKNNATPFSRTIQTGTNSYETISECPKSIGGGEIIGGTCPDECPSKSWTDVTGKNYQIKCGGTILNPKCEYQCKQGYYGTGASCTRCPSSGGVQGTTSGTGATSITECYIPSGSNFSDSTGKGTYTGNCYYSN